MDFKNLFDDDRAVSPVIGVILMVAITVILAAVIGSFVLGLGDQLQDTSPQASFGFSTGTETIADDIDTSGTDGPEGDMDVTSVTISHQSGDSISENNLAISVGGATAYGVENADDDSENNQVAQVFDGSGDVSAGTSVTIVAATNEDLAFSSGDVRYDPDDSATQKLDIVAGDGTRVDAVSLSSDETVRVVWSSESGGSSSTLGKFTLP